MYRAYLLTLAVLVHFIPKPTIAQTHVIPVVFHILHMGGKENISDSQVIDAMRILNNDFNKRNADTAQVYAPFNTNIANVGIEFRLANKDPYGNCTNGIDRIYSEETYVGQNSSKINYWPRDRYLNIWVVKQNGSGAAGYTLKPADADSVPLLDGLIMLHDYIGSIGTGIRFRSRALTHEIGHYLNLSHNWNSCGEDSVSDTPVTDGSASCSDSAHFSCGSTMPANVNNFMLYSFCSCMFTNGQKARMLATLNSPVAQRNNLSTPFNLIATGTDNAVQTPCITGIPIQQQKLLAITPNPFNSNVSLSGLLPGKYQITILDITGATLKSEQLEILHNDAITSIALSEMQNGIYFLKIQGNNLSETKRIVKQ